MILRNTLTIGLLSLLFGCGGNSQNTVVETFQIDGDTITTKSSESDNSLDANYTLFDLSPELRNHIGNKLKEAEALVIKYNGQLPASKYDANTLDEVFVKWRQANDKRKESPEYVIEALGTAFGEGIVNSLDCDWQVLSDQNGTDLVVVHKKYKVNGFPFSTAEKIYTENQTGYFQSVKLTIKHHIEEAKRNGKVQERQSTK